MEKKIQKKVDEYFNNLKLKISNNDFNLLDKFEKYPRLILEKEDFLRRKRNQNIIPFDLRCQAKRANQEQCTRRHKVDHKFCGTHIKGTPHGIINQNNNIKTLYRKKIHIFSREINGILYFIDKENNIYNHGDIYNQTKIVSIIGKLKDNNIIEFFEKVVETS